MDGQEDEESQHSARKGTPEDPDFFESLTDVELSKCAPVKFVTEDGKIFTQTYSQTATVEEIRLALAKAFAISSDCIEIRHDGKVLLDAMQLFQLSSGWSYRTIELELICSKEGGSVDAERAYDEYLAVPDVITVRVDDSDTEDGYRDVVVEIVDRRIVKPFLGGYYNKDTGLEYHHGYTQTGPAPPKVLPHNKNHRDTQTYFVRNRLLETKYARATQMHSRDVWIPNVTDKIVTSGPYETADEREKRLDVEGKVRTIQRYFRAWKIRKALKIVCEEYRKRIRIETELQEMYLRENADRKKRELITKVFPRTKSDFCTLYAMVERWKKSEIKHICNTLSGTAKIAAFYLLLDKEIEMLRSIEARRYEVVKEMKSERDRKFFATIGDPVSWTLHYKTWLGEYRDFDVEMDTLETQKGLEYYKIHHFLSDKSADTEDKLQALSNIKLLFHNHICTVSRELVALIDRACELMVRGIRESNLDILMERIKSLLIKHIKMPECSYGVTNRYQRVREKCMIDNTFVCKRCTKLKSKSQFEIHARTKNINICMACAQDDPIIEPKIDIAPYRYMLRLIRRDERTKQSMSSVAFIMQDKDIYHIVINIWHGHSAISESTDLYNLRLCRWFKEQNWSPWNCVLLTAEEADAHLKVKNLETVYDRHFLDRVFNKQALAKLEFQTILKLESYFREFGEFDSRWNEIRNVKKFEPVNIWYEFT